MAKVSSRTYSGKKPNDMSFLIKTASEGTQKYYAVTEGKSWRSSEADVDDNKGRPSAYAFRVLPVQEIGRQATTMLIYRQTFYTR